VLEEAANSSFSGASQVYSGAGTSYAVSGKSYGTYYYRVKATRSGYLDSSWRSGSGCAVSELSPMMVWADGSAIALRSDGTVLTWGLNYYGTVGDGTTEHQVNPIRVKTENGSLLSNVKNIHVSGDTSYAVTKAGEVYSWGYDRGDGSITPFPKQIVDLSGQPIEEIKQFSPGYILTYDGIVYAVEPIADGRIGLMLKTTVLRHKDGTIVNNVIKLAHGNFSNYLLKNDGSILAWGNNSNGELRDGTMIDQPYPVSVLGVDGTPIIDAIDIAGSYDHYNGNNHVYSVAKLSVVHNNGKVSNLSGDSYYLKDYTNNEINDAINVVHGFYNWSILSAYP
jgi:hypothetical protein